jgi:hypothetical protein
MSLRGRPSDSRWQLLITRSQPNQQASTKFICKLCPENTFRYYTSKYIYRHVRDLHTNEYNAAFAAEDSSPADTATPATPASGDGSPSEGVDVDMGDRQQPFGGWAVLPRSGTAVLPAASAAAAVAAASDSFSQEQDDQAQQSEEAEDEEFFSRQCQQRI